MEVDYWTRVRAIPMDKNTFRKQNLSIPSSANCDGFKVVFPTSYGNSDIVLWFDTQTFNMRFKKEDYGKEEE